MFTFKNLYGNLGFQTSYEESIPEGSEQAALANEEGQAASPAKAKSIWLSLALLIVGIYLLSR